jgi:predicted neutral ceramidase superfamily lipid hydrolase
MRPEERLDRLERIARLFVGAGLRARTNIRKQHENMLEQHEKINMLIDAHNRHEDLFNKRFARNEERFARNEERFERTQQAIDRLVAAQTRTDEKLQGLIDTLRRTNFGGSFA